MKYTLALLALTSALAGCQKLAYQPAEGDNTATLVFSSDNVAVQPMICVPGKGFEPTEYAVSQAPFKSDFFTQLNDSLKKAEQVETTVPAGTSLRIGFSYAAKDPNKQGPGVGDRCKLAIVFKPEAGGRYDAHFSLPDGECAMSLSRASQPVEDAVIAPWECR